jgi:hypothetical protein
MVVFYLAPLASGLTTAFLRLSAFAPPGVAGFTSRRRSRRRSVSWGR